MYLKLKKLCLFQIFFLSVVLLLSCNSNSEKITDEDWNTHLKKSKQFLQLKNQFQNQIDYKFIIDTTESIMKESVAFLNINLNDQNSIYLGKRNDTIYSYDSELDYTGIFLVLDEINFHEEAKLKYFYSVEIPNKKNSIFTFKLNRVIDNDPYDDSIILGNEYPINTISEIEISSEGRIINIILETTNNSLMP